jgi:hypothetical protein
VRSNDRVDGLSQNGPYSFCIADASHSSE